MSEPQGGQATSAIREADVLIVGGGLSGTLLAMQLLRLPGARHIVLVEPRAELGRGGPTAPLSWGTPLTATRRV